MALVASVPKPLEPEIKLLQAIHDFETILSDGEKTQLRSQGPPDATAAINLTTLIDRKCSSGRSKCIGQRLMTFLEPIQQFSQVADMFVSSHPEVAALAANNFSTYFDRLSTLLMTLGRQCPRIRSLGSLYPSKGLQKAMCGYFAVVIRLCKHVTQSLRKPAFTRLSKALFVSFDAEFAPYQSELIQLSREVQFEASLASTQAQKQEYEFQAREREESRDFRRYLIKRGHESKKEKENMRLEINRRKSEREKSETLGALSTYDYQKTYRQILKQCVPSTSMWIYDTPEFHEWMAGALKTLRFKGRLGSGKSVTSACVAATLIEKFLPGDVAMFFCRFDEPDSLRARTIIGSLARQLVYNLPASKFSTFDQQNIEGDNIIKYLEDMFSDNRQSYIVLDGLDECEEEQIREVADIFHGLLLSPKLNVKLFWSSRPNVLSWLPTSFMTQQHIDLETVEYQGSVDHDIRTFIRATLEEWLDGETPELRINDPNLIETILDRLAKGAQGMFLWVKFQLLTLRHKKSDRLILAALEDLPRDLPETFERILSKSSNPDDADLGKQIFRWVSIAKRPLTVAELQEAIGTEPLQKAWSSDAYTTDMTAAMACCGNLIFTEEEMQTVHFTHSSVKQYLLSSTASKPPSKYYVDSKEADEVAGAICITYLNFPMFHRQVAHTLKWNVRGTDITSAVIKNNLPVGTVGTFGNRIALKWLRSPERDKKPGKSVQHLLEEARNDTEFGRKHNDPRDYPFYQYAKQFWLEHTSQGISPDSGKIWGLWCNLIKEASWRDTLAGVPWTPEDCRTGAPPVIDWIVEQNHCSLAQLIIGTDGLPKAEIIEKLFYDAAKKGHKNLIEITLGAQHIPQAILDSGLNLAAERGYLEIIELLLRKKARVNTTVYDYSWGRMTVLQAAARGGHIAVVERLIQEKANINTVRNKRLGWTALQAAAQGGYLDIVERLLQGGADINAPPACDYGRTALQVAAEGGHLEVVERLLQEKVDVNAYYLYNKETALQLASEGGHQEVVGRLKAAGARI